jgi:hypothetical protein
MKPLTLINKRILAYFLLSVVYSSLMVSSIRLKKQTDVENLLATNTTMRDPIIDTTRKILGKDANFEEVTYVKEISAGGQAALKMADAGE